MDKIPCVVIGAGAVGLAIGKVMAEAGIATIVMERHGSIGTENSSRNSEVLHAGLYYQPGSLKAKLCYSGRSMMIDYMDQRKISYKKCGKLIIAATPKDLPQLHKIYENGRSNGLEELSIINREDISKLEPHVSACEAILSPFTSIFDSHDLMLNFYADIEEASAHSSDSSAVVFDCAVEQVRRVMNDGKQEFEIATSQGCVRSDFLVNAAGLSAQHIAFNRIVGYPKHTLPPLFLAKGNYYKIAGLASSDTPFRRLIYPIPAKGGLGVHATLDLAGNVRFGPDVEWILSRCDSNRQSVDDPYAHPLDVAPPLDFTVNEGLEAAFVAEIRKYWPAVTAYRLEPDYAGIRPKPVGPYPTTATATAAPAAPATIAEAAAVGQDQSQAGQTQYQMKSAADFLIHDRSAHGIQGLVCLYGIESPGLTSSLAIAHYVKQQLLFNQ